MGHRIKDESLRRSPGNDSQWDAAGGDSMSDEVESTHVSAGNNDALTAFMGAAEDRCCVVRHWHQLCQISAREML